MMAEIAVCWEHGTEVAGPTELVSLVLVPVQLLSAVGLVSGTETAAQGPSPPLPQGASLPGNGAGLLSRGRCALNER